VTDFIAAIEDLPLDATTKGLPLADGTMRLGDIGKQGWNLARGDLMFPVLALRDAHLSNNLQVMRDYAAHHGVSLAPHGKSSFCPQLYREQLTTGGSWGITAATVPQALLVAKSGAPNILIANEMVGRANVEQLVRLRHAFPEVTVYSLVDTPGALDQLARHGKALLKPGERFHVLLEVGFPGGRAGVRSFDQAKAMIELLMQRGDLFDFAGVECYEGLVHADTKEATIEGVDRLLDLTVDVFNHARSVGAFQGRAEVILTAGGSAYYDRVVSRFKRAQTGPGTRIVLRGGSCLTYDHGFYLHFLEDMDARSGFQTGKGQESAVRTFTPALEMWAAVTTLQDDGVAVMNMGIRDLPYDLGYPVPLRQYRDGALLRGLAGADSAYKVVNSNDQHCYMTYAKGADIAVGDVVAFGISHPCTAFDKWSVLYRVDESFNVTGALKTFF